MKKKTLVWLYIGAIFMIIVSAVASIPSAILTESSADFIAPLFGSVISLTFLEDIRCIRFGGILKPRLGWLIRSFEKKDPEKYLKDIEQCVYWILFFSAVFFLKAVAALIFKLISNILS